MNFPLILSLIIHIVFIIGSAVSIRNPFTNKLQDKGFTVFEYKEIGMKSKAPILSQDEGHASKTKTRKKDTDATPKARKSMQNETIMKQQDDKQQGVSSKNKKKNTPNKTVTKKNEKKKADKAVINLKRDKKSSAKADPNATKKAFDSVLNDAIASGDNENEGIKAEEIGNTLTETQINLVKNTIKKCWHTPARLKNAEEILVDIKMELSRDGNVIKAEIVDKNRLNSDADFRIAAENAYRAVLDPKCSPLPLPPDKYEEWKDLELTFNPHNMF